jgi:hypothetical protein
MEIKTLDKTIINTDKLSDTHAELIETVQKSNIRETVIKYDGFCYILAAVNGAQPWSCMHIPNQHAVDYILNGVNSLMLKVTEGKFKLAVVPVENV